MSEKERKMQNVLKWKNMYFVKKKGNYFNFYDTCPSLN